MFYAAFMRKIAIVIMFALLLPVGAVHFPVYPLGMCYEGVEKLVREDAYPGSIIAYNSSINHVWLQKDDMVIDTYFGEMSKEAAGYVPEKTYQTWEEFTMDL